MTQNKLDFEGALEWLKHLKENWDIIDDLDKAGYLDEAYESDFIGLFEQTLTLASKVQTGELVVVPSEPTKEIRYAMYDADLPHRLSGRMDAIYKAMIQAAPKYDWGSE